MMGVAERLAADALPSTRVPTVPTTPPYLLLPSTVTPADIQRAERKLADRLAQGEISVSSTPVLICGVNRKINIGNF